MTYGTTGSGIGSWNLPATELSRRLCQAHHPHLSTTGNIVPCGEHVAEGHRLYNLTLDRGQVSLEVILKAKAENEAAKARQS